ncbi:UNVERIFIED_CONTAM: TonB-dependent receptor, partial [Prevotella sp. 15_C9]
STVPRPPMGIEGREHIIASQQLYFEPSTNFKAQAYGSVFFINQDDLVQDLVLTQGRDYTWGAKMSYTVRNWLTLTASLHND